MGMLDAESEDRLLGGRIKMVQPEVGYRVAIDPLLLAAAVPARSGECALDLGMGAGAVALALAARVSGLMITGLEVQAELATLARRNAALNGMDNISVIEGSLAVPPASLKGVRFDQVVANPPYLEAERAAPVPGAMKETATVESSPLAVWIEFALKHLAPGGAVTVIHRADRLADLISLIGARLGRVRILPLWPKQGEPAKRVIVSARQGSKAPLVLLPGLVLHEPDGRYTREAEAVLSDGRALSLEPRR